MSFIKNITAKFKVLVRLTYLSYPMIYYSAQFLRKTEQYPTKQNDDLVVEAYPSSANSFFFVAVKNTFKSLKIAHHSHSIASLKIAIYYKIPIVIVIRNPLDAISSRIVRFNDNISVSISEYIAFYSYVDKNIKNILVFKFERVTTDINLVLKKISNYIKIPIELTLNEADKIKNDTFHEIDQHYEKRGRLAASATPNNNRNFDKDKIKNLISKHE